MWLFRNKEAKGCQTFPSHRLPALLLLFTKSGSTALEARDNISIYPVAPFISKEVPTRHGTKWILRGHAFRHLFPNR